MGWGILGAWLFAQVPQKYLKILALRLYAWACPWLFSSLSQIKLRTVYKQL